MFINISGSVFTCTHVHIPSPHTSPFLSLETCEQVESQLCRVIIDPHIVADIHGGPTGYFGGMYTVLAFIVWSAQQEKGLEAELITNGQ